MTKRYIDGNALQKEYQKEHGKRLLLIDVAPTADVVEVKHGEWKMQMLHHGVALFYCSECGFGKHIEDNRAYEFCPNCGADMREETEDE